MFFFCKLKFSGYLSVACICSMQGGQAPLVSVKLFFDLEQLRRMQNFTCYEVLDLEGPTLADFLNAWLTCSRIFAYLGDAPRSVLQACTLSREATLRVLYMPRDEVPSDDSSGSDD